MNFVYDECVVFAAVTLFEFEFFNIYVTLLSWGGASECWYREQSLFIEYKRYILRPEKPDMWPMFGV
jgi:hypothetical protein